MGYKSGFKGSTVVQRLKDVRKKQDILVSGQNIKTILNQSILGSGELDITGVLYKNITYQSLLDLREDSFLVPGIFYRITDYVTTTSQVNTQSMGHQFDVIVLALTNDTLAERAWACHHTGDTYFLNSHLEAWQIWYCLDNDVSRFAWATPTSSGGKGVIYRMIDEFGNDCPYDFKNIAFDSLGTGDFFYTFTFNDTTTARIYDISILGRALMNIVKGGENVRNLPVITFFSISSGSVCINNTIGENSTDISVTYTSGSGHVIGKNCQNISITGGVNNCIEDNCQNISIKGSNNKIGLGCIGIKIYDNSFNNVIGAGCLDISLRFSQFNIFESGCSSIYLGSTTQADGGGVFKYNRFESGVTGLLIRSNSTTYNPSGELKNYHFCCGVGTEGASVPISLEENRDYQTYITNNSSGVRKELCLGDLAQ